MDKGKSWLNIDANGSRLGEVCEALAYAVGQIAPNPCYMKCRLIKQNFKLKR